MSIRNVPRIISSILLLGALGLFAYALIAFFAPVPGPEKAGSATPELAKAAPNPHDAYDLERYAGLSQGSMFFKAPLAPVSPPPPVASKLVVRAIFAGERAKAVLSPAGEPPEGRSFVAGVGDVVEGERIIRINHDSVVVEIQGQSVILRIP